MVKWHHEVCTRLLCQYVHVPVVGFSEFFVEEACLFSYTYSEAIPYREQDSSTYHWSILPNDLNMVPIKRVHSEYPFPRRNEDQWRQSSDSVEVQYSDTQATLSV